MAYEDEIITDEFADEIITDEPDTVSGLYEDEIITDEDEIITDEPETVTPTVSGLPEEVVPAEVDEVAPASDSEAGDSLVDEQPERTLSGTAKDIGITALKGAISVPEAVVGLGDIVSGGHAGKAAEEYFGFKPKEAKAILSSYNSPAQKYAQEKVKAAKGFVNTLQASVSHPSIILETIGESLPLMGAGGVVGRGIGAFTKLSPWVTGAIGEGVVGAGMAAEQIRQETATGLLSPKQSAFAAASGTLTGLINIIGGRVAEKYGLADINTLMAGGKVNNGIMSKTIVGRIVGGGISEGMLEELPQSAQEQIWQNAALNKPLLEGVPESAAQGLLAGGLMGAGVNITRSSGPMTNATGEEGKPKPLSEGRTTPISADEVNMVVNDIYDNAGDPNLSKKELAEQDEVVKEALENILNHDLLSPEAEQLLLDNKDLLDQYDVQKKGDMEQAVDAVDPEEQAPTVEPPQPAPKDTAAEALGLAATDAVVVHDSVMTKVKKGTYPTDPAEVAYFEAYQGAVAEKNKVEKEKQQRLEEVAIHEGYTDEGTDKLHEFGSKVSERNGKPTINGAKESSKPAEDKGKRIDKADGRPDKVIKDDGPRTTRLATGTKKTITNKSSIAEGQTVETDPSIKQQEAGNYEKPHKNIDGMGFTIENPAGTTRSGTAEDGKSWSQKMAHDYGYIKGTVGFDKDQVDVFFSKGYEGGAETVHIVNQTNKDGSFDEHKVVIGAKSIEEARTTYNANYEKGWTGGKSVIAMPMKEFKKWVKSPGPKKGELFETATPEAFQKEATKIVGKIKTMGVMSMVSARANALGMTVEQYVKKRGLKLVTGEEQTVAGKKVTDEMRQANKGVVDFSREGQAIIHAFDSADISTIVHELGHIFRRELSPAEMKIAERWIGVKPGEGWTVEQEEKFARGWEQYIASGKADGRGIKQIFGKFSRWMMSVYQSLQHPDINVEITPEVKALFDGLLSNGVSPKVLAQSDFQAMATSILPGLKFQGKDALGLYHFMPEEGPTIGRSFSLMEEPTRDDIIDAMNVINTAFDGPDILAQSTSTVDIESRRFKRWFRGSKVVDENGKPLVVYHGTKSETNIDIFDGGVDGIWFAENPQISDQFGDNRVDVFLSSDNHIDLTDDRNKKILDEIERDHFPGESLVNADGVYEPLSELVKWGDLTFNGRSAQTKVIQAIKDRGYTGLKWADYHGDAQDMVHVVFEPTQIKSASSNTGEFSDTNPDILAQKAVDVPAHKIAKEENISYNKAREMVIHPNGLPTLKQIFSADVTKIRAHLLPDVLMGGLKFDPVTKDVTFDEVSAALSASKDVFFQGVETKIPTGKRGAGRYLRGGKVRRMKNSARTVYNYMKNIGKVKLSELYDGTNDLDTAYAMGNTIDWLTPVVQESKQGTRWSPNKKGMYGNDKLAFPSYSYPKGRNTWDIPGCGREAWAVSNGMNEFTAACYGGMCYAEVLKKLYQGKKSGVTKGINKKRVSTKAEIEKFEKAYAAGGYKMSAIVNLDPTVEVIKSKLTSVNMKGTKTKPPIQELYNKSGIRAVRKHYPRLTLEEGEWFKFTLGRFVGADGTVHNVRDVNNETINAYAAVVSTNLQDAKGVDIRLGVDTDGSAWLSRPDVMDAIMKANPRTLSVYSSAYHKPPLPHDLSKRTIINVTVSGWHSVTETFSRLRWADKARKNGWNVILREVVANPDSFELIQAERYNRMHDALMTTDFFIMQQPLHEGANMSNVPMWGMPACCKGSKAQVHTCDQCEVAEGLGKGFQQYWNIHEELDTDGEIVLEDSDYEGRKLGEVIWSGGIMTTLEEEETGDTSRIDDVLMQTQSSKSRLTKLVSTKQTTPQFKKWFGDSKVVNPDGSPKTVYHGSPTLGKDGVHIFKEGKATKTVSPQRGLGNFFTENRVEAGAYAGPGGNVFDVFLSIKNPLEINSWDLPVFTKVAEAKAFAKRKQLQGYDGLYIEDENHWVAFDSVQSKVTENIAPSTGPDIMFQSAQSPEFKKWFKGSVITVDGKVGSEPLQVYHGTMKDFSRFRRGELGSHFGTPEQAGERIGGLLRAGYSGLRVLPVYLNLKNPIEISDLGDWSDMGMLEEYLAEANEGPFTDEEFSKFTDEPDVREGLKKKGYDGVMYENRFEGEGYSYIAFESNQIKSVWNTKPTSDPDILYQAGATIDGQKSDASAEYGADIIIEIMRKLKVAATPAVARQRFDDDEVIKMMEWYIDALKIIKDPRASVAAKQDFLAKFSFKIPLEARGKLLKPLQMVAKLKTSKGQNTQITKFLARADKEMSSFLKKQFQKKIKKSVKPLKYKKGVKRGRGWKYEQDMAYIRDHALKFDRDKVEHEIVSQESRIDQANEVLIDPNSSAYGKQRAQEKIETAESRITMAQLFGNMKEKTFDETIGAYQALNETITEGRATWRAANEARKADLVIKRIKAAQNITGEKDPTPENAADARRRERKMRKGWGKFKELLSSAENLIQSWELMLDKISSKDGAGILKSWLVTHFSSVYQYATRNNKQMDQDTSSIIQDKAKEIFGKKTNIAMNRKFAKLDDKPTENKIFLYPEGNKTSMPMTEMEAAYWYLIGKGAGKDNKNIDDTFTSMGVTEQTLNQIENFLSPEVQAWADWIQLDFLESYHDGINEVHRLVEGINLTKSKDYITLHRKVVGKVEDKQKDAAVSGRGLASMKKGSLNQRVYNTNHFKVMNLNDVLIKHTKDMNHYKSWAVASREINGVFNSPEIQNFIKQHYGNSSAAVIRNFQEAFVATPGQEVTEDEMKGLAQWRGRVATFMVGMNPVVFMKQLTSMPAFAADIPVATWTKYTTAAILNPMKAWNTVKSSPMLIDRWKAGHERDVAAASRLSGSKLIAGVTSMPAKMMVLTKLGDSAAIVVGGYAVYKYHYNKAISAGKSVKEADTTAMVQFEASFLRSQQSAGVGDLGWFLRGGQMQRMFTLFLTAPAAYSRQIFTAVRHLKDDPINATKRLIIYGVILPAVFQTVADAFLIASGDDDDQDRALSHLLKALGMGIFNGIPGVRTIANISVENLIGGESFMRDQTWSPMTELIKQPGKALYYGGKYIREGDDEMFDKAVENLIYSGGILTGIPTKNFKKIWDGVNVAYEGKTDHPLARLLGYSDYALNERD